MPGIRLLPSAVHPSPVELVRVRDTVSGSRALRDPALFHRVRPGVYAPRTAWERLPPWDRYLARVHAYALVNPDAVFALASAAALLGLPLFGEARHIHLHAPHAARSRRFGDVFVHASVDDREIVERGGCRMTSRSHTAVDLMRVLPAPFGLAVGDAAISPVQGGDVEASELRELARDRADSRGSRVLRLTTAALDARSESVGESVSRGVVIWSGFETPELQVEFRSPGFVDRVDLFWVGADAIAESDGYEKYLAQTPEQTAERVIAEKRREDRLRRQCTAFGRWDMAAAIAVTPVVTELVRLGVRRVAAPRTGLLTPMRSNPRSLPRAARQRNRDETTPRG
ncbi:hypothetical protein [Microbacterium gallinarum]|uniref:Transcriptional regulator, AbiEi antitoxin, Type IV TA system n=1 Tax=Microbacterium gallinarum TaxID=2762209 RepID=A0ABR8X375_9MICO|nr:hypothetical protein [Microbacterium gallinarum]MBD8023780.1 hypothetical protein [Microbacterium gallinarum]